MHGIDAMCIQIMRSCCVAQGALLTVLWELNGKDFQKRGDVCTLRADSRYSAVETNITL